ncbi:dephospho-CoA kinase [Bacteroides sp. 214]|uniref:dephospho-CoA kinase n=1 Tax=Bacteroides sp. 214 TaxID=2302935 RepID=UPI0013D17017|nr:dephospho-CoA kinase [Bacteroides sp. 214]NDW13806.1 dephospho-CoA kinase [Bacteroides sp. 214]
MIKIGITGGIGSGKSVVSQLLQTMGIPVYISDTASKQLTTTDPYIREQLTQLLGEEIYQKGELNKPLLASYLFESEEHMRIINQIIHPRVKEDFRKWTTQQSANSIVAMESAILIEAGFRNEVDCIVMVYSSLEIRIERAMQRDNTTRELIAQRIEKQMDDELKKTHADYIIYNDETHPLIPQVTSFIEKLRNCLSFPQND